MLTRWPFVIVNEVAWPVYLIKLINKEILQRLVLIIKPTFYFAVLIVFFKFNFKFTLFAC